MPAPPAHDDYVETSALGLDVDLPAIAVHNRQQPFLAFDDLAELLEKVVVPLKYLAVAVDAAISAVETLLVQGATVLLIRLEQLESVARHVLGERVRQVVCVRKVTVLELVVAQPRQVLDFAIAVVVVGGVEQRNDADLLNEVDAVS